MVSVRTHLTSILCLLAIALSIVSVQDTRAQTPENTTYVGLGAGSLVFLGDVGDQNRYFSPSLGRLGYHLTLSNEITPFLHGGLEAMFGKVGASERGDVRNLNFRSEIRSGGVFATYNFDHVLPIDRAISPIFSLGVSGFEFLSKSDLRDAEGRTYHYWDDGTIRDIAQDAPNAAESVLLVRDYEYESDLRELDLDGLGDYSERGVALPIGIGAEFKMGDYLHLNIHTRYYLTTTDLIDNVSSEGTSARKGDSANDAFVYTGFVVRYGLHKKIERADSPAADLLATINDKSDEDKDGVLDIIDQCPRTPEGVEVDVNGCPVDGDGDGVPDYLDQELETAEGVYVDEEGVTLTDEDFARKYKRFLSGSEVNIVEGTIESADIPEFVFTPRPTKDRRYMVKVDETEDGISAELATMLLSIPDVQTINNGDTTMYMVGDYDALPDAVRRKMRLDGLGIGGEVIRSEEGEIYSEAEAAAKLEKEFKKEMKGETEEPTGVFWRVQLGAFKNKLSYNVFSAIDDVVIIYGDDGLTRYFSGVYDEQDDGEVYRQILQNSGFNDAFLVGFYKGQRLNVHHALSLEDEMTSDQLWKRASTNAFDTSVIEYKVMLAQSEGTISTEELEHLRELGSIEQMTTPNKTVYLTGNFLSSSEAQFMLDQVVESGLEDAVVVGIFNGEILSLEEIDQMKKN